MTSKIIVSVKLVYWSAIFNHCLMAYSVATRTVDVIGHLEKFAAGADKSKPSPLNKTEYWRPDL